MAARGAAVLALVSGFVCGLTLTAPGSLETWLVDDLSLSHGLVGLTQSAFFAGNLAGSLAAGWLLRGRLRAVGVLSMALVCGGNALCGAGALHALLAGRLLAGLGVSTSVIFCSAVLVHAYGDARQGALLNALHASIAGGAAVALGGARRLGLALGSWRAPLLGAGVLGLAPLALAAGTALPAPNDDASQGPRTLARALRRPALLVTLLLMVGYMVSEQGATTFFAAYLEHEGLAAGSATLVAGSLWVGLGAGRLLSAALSARISEDAQLLVCSVGGAVLLAAAILGLFGGALTLGGTLAAGLLLGPVIPLCFSRAVRQVEGQQGPVLGLSNAAGCLGGAAGPLLVGLVADALSLRLALLVGCGALLICVAPFALWRNSAAARVTPSRRC